LRLFTRGGDGAAAASSTTARAAGDGDDGAGSVAEAGDIAAAAPEASNSPAGTPLGVPYKRYHGAKLMMENSVFAELKLNEASAKVGGIHIRQHVNPFKASLQKQAPTPDWKNAFASAKPLCVDIGCGGGRFDLLMAGTDG